MTGRARASAALTSREAAAVLLPPRFAVRAGFPALIAVLGYLLMLTAAGGTLAGLQLLAWRQALFDRLVVEILPDAAQGSDPVPGILARLRTVAGVAEAAAVPEDRIARLAAPWLGEGAQDAVPLPRLIAVRLAQPEARAAVTRALASFGERVRLFTPHEAITGLAARVRIAIWLALACGALMLGATVLLVVFAVQAEFASHLDTLSLARALGADDRVILGAFAHRFAVLAGRGAAIALGLSAATAIAAARLAAPAARITPSAENLAAPGAALAAALVIIAVTRLAAWASARAAVNRLA